MPKSDETSWTPGPWALCGYESFTVVRDYDGDGPYPGGGLSIAKYGSDTSSGYEPIVTLTWDEKCRERSVANARLIAAAPDLYEALRGLVGPTPQMPNAQALIRAHEALAKAEGHL